MILVSKMRVRGVTYLPLLGANMVHSKDYINNRWLCSLCRFKMMKGVSDPTS